MGMRAPFGRGAAVPQQMFYGTFASTPQLSAKHVPLYNDPSTWPKKFNQSQIKRLLKGKMKPGVVPDYKTLEVLHANKKCTEALLFVLHQHIFPSAQYVEDAMARCLAETFAGREKDGNVFAVLANDQALLNAMQLHVNTSDQPTNETVATRCGAIPFKRSRSVQRVMFGGTCGTARKRI
ncbi:Hypothetical protein, putative [Bodo saltans]|uniref:Uncharacterized protein n=1 Tax=Bodo saltans TaxID=75058 RepID=A0A0S4KGZ2_BODSA|nr:Hypothetical protein, putative [Bodo saltans]|eukprot:CUI14239.1 Hypothetical protein, putative [Bodo saltans]